MTIFDHLTPSCRGKNAKAPIQQPISMVFQFFLHLNKELEGKQNGVLIIEYCDKQKRNSISF